MQFRGKDLAIGPLPVSGSGRVQGKEIAASAMKLDNLYPYCQAGDYLYAALYDEKSQKYVTGFLALESLAEGEGGFISVGN